MKNALRRMIHAAEMAAYEGELLAAFDKINGEEFARICTDFFVKEKQNGGLESLNALCQENGVEYYTAQLLLVLCCAIDLYAIYRAKEYGEEIYFGVLRDFKAKLEECLQTFHIVGTNSAKWFGMYFTLDLFTIGRLGYELNCKHAYSYTLNGKTYSSEDLSLNIHIPSGKSLLREDVVQSLKGAYAFFADKVIDGVLPTYCLSWLLYRPYEEIFDKGNIKGFRDMFDIIDDGAHDEFYNGWRVFGVQDCSNPNALPQNTSLQKKFVEWIKEDKPHGYGAGILLFDGENILTEKGGVR